MKIEGINRNFYYRQDIQGLRALAVLSVLAFHIFPFTFLFKGGFIGVDIFFVISGYLITKNIWYDLNQNKFSFVKFYSKRIKRIFPSLILILTLSLISGFFLLFPHELIQLSDQIIAGTIFSSNILYLFQIGYFDTLGQTKPLLHLWSLAIEEQFYVIWPAVLLSLYYLTHKRLNLIASSTLFIAIISFILNIKVGQQNSQIAFFSPHTRFFELLGGGLLGFLEFYNIKKYKFIGFLSKDLTKNIFSGVGIALLIFGFMKINNNLNYPGYWSLVPMFGTILIISGGNSSWINLKFFSCKVAVWFGEISYPLYLWHLPILSFFFIIEGEIPSRDFRIMILLISIVLAWISYRFIEQPFRFGKYSNKTNVLILSMFILLFLGLKIHENNGYENRAFVTNFKNIKKQLIREPETDKECLSLFSNKTVLFPYCRFSGEEFNETVAIIGDSHAHVAYTGISEVLRKNGRNTILMANNGCPPYIGVTTGENQKEKNDCNQTINQILDALLKLNNVKKVLIFTRGPSYISGTEPYSGNKILTKNTMSLKSFVNAAKNTVNILHANGKDVIFVTENPELFYRPESCISRPLQTKVKDCSIEKTIVRSRQHSYISSLNLLNAKIVQSADFFCPKERCLAFDSGGIPLYADPNHLSLAGSKFQAENILKFLL